MWTAAKIAEFEDHVCEILRSGDPGWRREQMKLFEATRPEAAAFRVAVEDPANRDVLFAAAFAAGVSFPELPLTPAITRHPGFFGGMELHTWEALKLAFTLHRSGRYPTTSLLTLKKYVLQGPPGAKRGKSTFGRRR